MRADTRTYTEKHTRMYASPAQTFLCPDTEIKLSSSCSRNRRWTLPRSRTTWDIGTLSHEVTVVI